MSYRTVLAADPVLLPLLDKIVLPEVIVQEDVYVGLLRSIVSQQLSTKVAKVIFDRFLNLFPEQHPDPSLVSAIDTEVLRSVGLSYQKAGYIKNVAEFAIAEGLTKANWHEYSDQEIIDLLTRIKGVGKWTVEMILMFMLDRPDVFPIDDLGIRQGMIQLYNVTSTGKAQRQELEKIAEAWRPYRSYGCRLMWRYKDSL